MINTILINVILAMFCLFIMKLKILSSNAVRIAATYSISMIFDECKLFLDHPISTVNTQGLAVENDLKSTSLNKSQFFADCLMDGQVC